MDTTPYWIDSAPLPRFPRIDRDLDVDTVIVGAGITGLTTAYLLKKAGQKVAVLERERCARIDTGHTTAHLTAVTDLSRQAAIKTFGRDAARAVWDAGIAAIDQIVTNIRAEDIACDFRWVPGFLHAPFEGGQPGDHDFFSRELAAARELDIAAERLDSIPLFGLPGIKFPHQALFHPRKYLSVLAQRIPGGGSHIFEDSEVNEVEEKPLSVRVGDRRIRTGRVVFATHNPLTGTAGLTGATLFQSKLALYTSYAISAHLPADTLPEASFWDTSEPYNYLRLERRRDHVYGILGGEDHKTGQEPDTLERYRRLEERLRRLLPEAQVEHRWSGQVIETNDGFPFIGELSPGQFGATGFAGNGMTFGTLGAMMAADWILGRRNPWSDLFDPGRKQVRGGMWSYLKENKDYPYYLVRDVLGGTEGKSLRALKRGHGKILHLDGRKVAAYRDPEGAVTLCSPVCTHLKCIVGWNEAERTWDCPCHGSRFKPTGEVISGPAEEPLEKLPVQHDEK